MFIRIGAVIGATVGLAVGGDADAQTAPFAGHRRALGQVTDRGVISDVNENGHLHLLTTVTDPTLMAGVGDRG